jgi:hypothetical protein
MATLTPDDDDLDLGDDLLSGADKIAEYLFKDPEKRRRVYHLNEKNELPLFYMGATLCGRKSTLKKHIADAERCRGDRRMKKAADESGA